MTVPVWVEEQNGTFTASVAGDRAVLATGATREAAIAALRVQLVARVSAGGLVLVDVQPGGVLAAAGAFRDDPTLDEIVREAYRRRDELKAREFPE